MAEVYASNEVTVELLDPITGETLSTSILYRRDISISERPVYAQRGYHRSNTLSATHLRSLGSVTLRKDAESLALANEIKRWQKGVVFYALSSDLKGKRFRHPNLRVTFTNADGTTDVQTAYHVKISDRTLSAPDGGIVGDAISLDSLGGIDSPQSDNGEPVRALDFHRTGSATYLNTSGTFTTATDSQARFGLPWVVRRNRWLKSETFSDWTPQATVTIQGNQGIDTFGRAVLAKMTNTAADSANCYRNETLTLTSKTWKVSFDAYAPSGSATVKVSLSNLTDQQLDTTQAITGTVARYTVTLGAFNATSHTTARLIIVPSQGAAQAIYFGNVQIEETTATPYQATNATGVDLTNPVNGPGLVLEGSGTNLLTANQSDVETDTTGFSVAGGGVITLSRDTAQKFTGNASLKVVTDGAASAQGVACTHTTASQGTYTGQLRIKGTTGIKVDVWLRVNYSDATSTEGTYTTVTLDGGWQFTPTAAVSTNSSKTVQSIVIYARLNGTAATTFWIDTLQLEANPFATSWMTGGTTRSPDLCGIVQPHNLLKWSEGFDNAVWVPGGGSTVTANNATAPDGTLTADTVRLAAGYAIAQTGINVVSGKTQTFSCLVKVASGTQAFKFIYNDGVSNNFSVEFTATTEWQRFCYTITPAASGSGNVQIYNHTATTANLIVLGAQLTEGYHPGPYVKTTDTAIPAPVSPALDPAWQQNGRLKVRILPPPLSTGKDYNLFGPELRSAVTAGILRLYRDTGTVATASHLYFDRKHNSSTGLAGTPGRARFELLNTVLYDGAPHDVEMEWSNEIRESDGVREMWMRIWIDDVLVAQQDVAALYGATAWATIDPSRLISDGNAYGVLGNVQLLYPTPRAGYRPSV